jgi:hypothetical protein
MDERQHAYSDPAPANDERDYLESSPEVVEPAVIRPGDLLSSDANGLGFRTEDGGLVHAVEGSRLVAGDPTTFFMWARCGRDVAVSEVWAANEVPTCPDCDAEPRIELQDKRAHAMKRLRLADLAFARARARVYRAVEMGEKRAALEAVKHRKECETAVQAAEKEYACLGR